MSTSIKRIVCFFITFMFLMFIGNIYYNNKVFVEVNVDQVDELHRWIVKNLKYIPEPKNNVWRGQLWKTAFETFKDGGGDCEDLATFGFEMLQRLGYHPRLVLVWYMEGDKKLGHAITIFKEKNGQISIFSNLEYRKTEFTNRYLLLNKFYPTRTKYIICDLPVAIFCEFK